MKNKRVVITGGAGFIGSHLAEAVAGRGYHTVILDDLSTGRIENIEKLLERSNVEFIKGSITDLPLLQEVFEDALYVFHQAALPSVPRSIESPQLSHQANLTGTLNVLIAARDRMVRKVIYASSSSVYGNTSTPNKEDMMPHPLSPYAVTKLAGEHYCQVFHQVYGLATVCLRYFNIYGPRQDLNSQYSAVIPRFIKMALGGDSPIIFGDGEQTRGFIFVKDAVEANILAAEGDACGVFNISQEESITINQLAELIIELVGNNVQPIHQEPRLGDIKHSLADVSKAKAFGYEPKYDLRAGLAETIRWFNAR